MSGVGPAIEKAQIKLGAKAAKFMRFTCTVTVPGAEANNGDGTTSQGEPATIENVPCDYAPLGAYERVTAGALRAGADYALEVPVVWQGAQLIVPADASVAVNATALIQAVNFNVVGPLPSKEIWKQRYAATLR